MKEAFLGANQSGYKILLGILCIGGVARLVHGGEDTAADGGPPLTPGDLSHGLGDHINWHTLEEGRELAQKDGKTLMLIIHKSWCGACQSLKPKFKESLEIGSLSKEFVMVNTEDDDEPKEAEYKPDGGYIPRILFLDSSGKLMDVTNEGGNPSYKYYYYDAESVAVAMRKAVSIAEGTISEKPESLDNDNSEETDAATEDELQQETSSSDKIEL